MQRDAPTIDNLSSLQWDLKQLLKDPIRKKVLVGFDGFVDKIKKPVKERQNSKKIYFQLSVTSWIGLPVLTARSSFRNLRFLDGFLLDVIKHTGPVS